MNMKSLSNKMTPEIWKSITWALLGILMGGAPGYFVLGPGKPSRMEVSNMIEKQTPYIIDQLTKDIRTSNSLIDKRLAVMEQRLIFISETVSDMKEKGARK